LEWHFEDVLEEFEVELMFLLTTIDVKEKVTPENYKNFAP
jgi:hypothetical protein